MQNQKFNPMASLLENSQGRFVGITFIKQDGSIRKMTARTGVTKGLKPEGCIPRKVVKNPSVLTEKNHQVLTVWDVQNKGYRSISKDRILEVTVQGVKASTLKF